MVTKKRKAAMRRKQKEILMTTLQERDPEYWLKMARIGVRTLRQQRKLEDPDVLWMLACEYFRRIDDNPYKRPDFIRGGDRAGEPVYLDSIRPYSWPGLNNFLFEHGIIAKLDDYRLNTNNAYLDFVDVIAVIDSIIRTQKFDGAMVGAFNAMITSKDLGLVDKTQMTVKVEQPLFGDGVEVMGHAEITEGNTPALPIWEEAEEVNWSGGDKVSGTENNPWLDSLME